MKRQRSSLYRAFLAGISVIYFFTNVTAVHASESTFWTERRRASFQKARGGEDISIGNLSTNPNSQKVLAQLPHASPMDLRGSHPPQNPTGANGNKDPFSLGPRTGDWLGKLVMPYGSINDVYLSPKPDAPFIVHIQDAHGIVEAQRNIASIIGLLTQEPGIRLVGLEGASGPFSLAPYRDFPNPAMRRDVADFFLKIGLIAGPEYAGLTLPQPPNFFGAENNALYLANVQALKTGYKGKESAQATFNALQSEAEKLKKTLYSMALKTFDTHFEAYHADKEKLADYVRYLIANRPSLSDRLSTTNLHLLVKALDEENILDFKRVDTERKQLVERLVEKLAKPDLQDLVDKSVDYRAGRMGYGDYHAHLRKICLDHNISLSEFPQLTRYISYVLLADKIDRKGLLNEMDLLERTLPESLARSPEEKKLVSLAHDLVLLNKLLRHEMTMADWTTYQIRREDMYRFGTRMAELNPNRKIPPALTKETLKPFEDFCFYATQRNITLTDNFSRQLAEEKTKSGILVAGGFHSEGLSALLRQRQISYVVVTPKITNVPTDNNYLDILAKDPVPLEQLLAGDRIYLSDAIALASNSDKAKTLNAIKDLLVGKFGKLVEVMKGLAVTTDRPTPGNLIGEMSAQGIKVYFVRKYSKGSNILNWAKFQAAKIKSTSLKVSTLGSLNNIWWGKNLRSALQQMRSWLADHHQWEAFAATGVALGFSVFHFSMSVMGGFAVGLVFLHLWLNHRGGYEVYQKKTMERKTIPFRKPVWTLLHFCSGLLIVPLLLAAYSSPILLDRFMDTQLSFAFLALATGLMGIFTYQFLHKPWDHRADRKNFAMKAMLFVRNDEIVESFNIRFNELFPGQPIPSEITTLARKTNAGFIFDLLGKFMKQNGNTVSTIQSPETVLQFGRELEKIFTGTQDELLHNGLSGLRHLVVSPTDLHLLGAELLHLKNQTDEHKRHITSLGIKMVSQTISAISDVAKVWKLLIKFYDKVAIPGYYDSAFMIHRTLGSLPHNFIQTIQNLDAYGTEISEQISLIKSHQEKEYFEFFFNNKIPSLRSPADIKNVADNFKEGLRVVTKFITEHNLDPKNGNLLIRNFCETSHSINEVNRLLTRDNEFPEFLKIFYSIALDAYGDSMLNPFDLFSNLPKNKGMLTNRELLTVILLDQYVVGDTQRNTPPEFSEISFLPYMNNPIFTRIRYLLAEKKYSDLKQLSPDRSTITNAFLLNNQNTIISQTTDLILDTNGDHILPGLVPLHEKVRTSKSASVARDDLLTLLLNMGMETSEESIQKLLIEQGFITVTRGSAHLIVPRVFDNFLSVYRGSSDFDHTEANYLTHSITTAVLHYARDGGEMANSGDEKSAYGATAFHEYDLGLLLSVGLTDRTVDPNVALAFHYNGKSLPEYARKRTVALKSTPMARHMQILLNWQLKERMARQNLQHLLNFVRAGQLGQTEIVPATQLMKDQLNILAQDCGLKQEYFNAVFGSLDNDFFVELQINYRPNQTNEEVLTRLLHEGMARVPVVISPARINRSTPLREVHPWLAVGRTLWDHLAWETSVRSGTYGSEDISTVSLQTVRDRALRESTLSTPIEVKYETVPPAEITFQKSLTLHNFDPGSGDYEILLFLEKIIAGQNLDALEQMDRPALLARLRATESDGYIRVDWESGRIELLPIPPHILPAQLEFETTGDDQSSPLLGRSEPNQSTLLQIAGTPVFSPRLALGAKSHETDTKLLSKERTIYIDPFSIAVYSEGRINYDPLVYGRAFILMGGIPRDTVIGQSKERNAAINTRQALESARIDLQLEKELYYRAHDVEKLAKIVTRLENDYSKIVAQVPPAITPPSLVSTINEPVKDSIGVIQLEEGSEASNTLLYFEKVIQSEYLDNKGQAQKDSIVRCLKSAEKDGYVHVDWEKGKIVLLPIPQKGFPNRLDHLGEDKNPTSPIFGSQKWGQPTYVKIPGTMVLTFSPEGKTYEIDARSLALQRSLYLDPESIARFDGEKIDQDRFAYGRTFILLGGIPRNALSGEVNGKGPEVAVFSELQNKRIELEILRESDVEDDIRNLEAQIEKLDREVEREAAIAPKPIVPPAKIRREMVIFHPLKEEGASLPDVRRIEEGTYNPLEEDVEHELARYEVKSGHDTFIILHTQSDPLGEERTVFEFLRILEFSRNGNQIPIPRGPYGIWEFQAQRELGKTAQIDSEQMSGIPHQKGDAPYFAGTALMAVMLKEVAGPSVPIVGVLAIKNAAALEKEILKSRQENRALSFEDLQNIPAFRDPECEYTLRFDDGGVARYTKTWRGPNFISYLDENSIQKLKEQENFDAFLELQNQIRVELDESPPAAAIPGVVRFLRTVMVSLVKLFPKAGWAREWKKLSRQGKLDRTIRVYAPYVESFFMGVAYWGITLLAQVALPMVGFDPGLVSNVSILSVLNVIFGLLHTEVYRKNPATGDWERRPATLGTQMGIAVIGLAFHSPLLLSTLNPFLAPLALIGGNVAASLLSGLLHRMYNDLVVPRLGKDQVSKIAKAAAVYTLAEELRTNLLGGNSALNLKLSELTKSRLSPLIGQLERRDLTEYRLLENLKTIGNEESTKPVLRHIMMQLKNTTSPLVAKIFEFAGARWAEQSPGPLAIAMHDWSDWQNNKNFIAFIQGAVGSAAKSNRKIVIATSPDHQKAIRSVFQFPSNTTFRDNEIRGQILDAGEFAKAAETKALLAANTKRMENTSGLDLFYLEMISRAISNEIRWLGRILEQA